MGSRAMITTTSERPIVRPDLLAVLEDGGYRITEPRRNVIAALDQKDEGFTAEELCSELPGVGRATVYRTIKLLQRSGVICKLAMPDGAPRYSLARVDHHHHTVCVKCGTIGEFKHATIERLLRLARRYRARSLGTVSMFSSRAPIAMIPSAGLWRLNTVTRGIRKRRTVWTTPGSWGRAWVWCTVWSSNGLAEAGA